MRKILETQTFSETRYNSAGFCLPSLQALHAADVLKTTWQKDYKGAGDPGVVTKVITNDEGEKVSVVQKEIWIR